MIDLGLWEGEGERAREREKEKEREREREREGVLPATTRRPFSGRATCIPMLIASGVPREQKMLKGHLPGVKYHQVYLYSNIIN